MTDAGRAREELAEVDRRRAQMARVAVRRGLPWWYVGSFLGVFLALAVQLDVRAQVLDWDGWFARWGVPGIGIVVVIALSVLAQRRAGVQARNDLARGPGSAMAVLCVSYLVLSIGIGIPLRSYDVPWDQTLSSAAASVLVLTGWSLWRARETRRTD